MENFLKHFFIGILALSSLTLQAAEPTKKLTLADATALAKQSNPELKKSELALDASSWNKLEAWSDHLPHVTVGATHFISAKYDQLHVVFGGNEVQFPEGFPQTALSAEVSLMLFDGLAGINRIIAAGYEHEAAELEYKHSLFRLEQWVRTRFFQALAAQEFATVANQNITTLEQHLGLAHAGELAGVSTRVDVLRIETQLEEARAEKILADDNVIIGRRALNEAMGVEEDSRELEGQLPVPNPTRVPADLKIDLSRRDDVQAQTKKELATDHLDSAAAGFWFPKVAIFGAENFYKFGNFDPVILPNSTFQNSYSVGIKMTWSLFDGGASIAKKAKANDLYKTQAENTRKLLISSPNDFEMWKRKYVYNAALFNAANARSRNLKKACA